MQRDMDGGCRSKCDLTHIRENFQSICLLPMTLYTTNLHHNIDATHRVCIASGPAINCNGCYSHPHHWLRFRKLRRLNLWHHSRNLKVTSWLKCYYFSFFYRLKFQLARKSLCNDLVCPIKDCLKSVNWQQRRTRVQG